MADEKKHIIPIRSLTVKEMRELRKAGYDPAFVDRDESAAATTGMVDWILDNIYAGQIADDMPYSEAFRIATDTYAMTYGRETEVKN
ncbi:hypothetical protein [uncultured Selenomonas sp.]|uniref:hypothetical protein n=1 Tax=uncultured Selenomonas sp. TaxID=159275 RepID=UPI0028D2BD91|nr:hypothetical protein [uncultured Selenomonas sp.]